MRLQRLALAMAGMGLLTASVVAAPANAGQTDPKPWSDLTKQSNSAKAAAEAKSGFPHAARLTANDGSPMAAPSIAAATVPE